MEYRKKAALKVECIASKEDFEFFGMTLEDVLDRTEEIGRASCRERV